MSRIIAMSAGGAQLGSLCGTRGVAIGALLAASFALVQSVREASL